MIQPTIRGLESPAAAAMSPYVTTLPGGIEQTSDRTCSTSSSVIAVIAARAPRRRFRRGAPTAPCGRSRGRPSEVGAEAVAKCNDERVGDVRRIGLRGPQQRGPSSLARTHRTASSLQYDIIAAGSAASPPGRRATAPDARQVRSRVPPQGPRPTTPTPCRRGLHRGRCNPGRQHLVGDLAHALSVQTCRRVQQHQRVDEIGRAAARFNATAAPNEWATTTTGRPPSASRSAASAPTFASIVHGASHDERP